MEGSQASEYAIAAALLCGRRLVGLLLVKGVDKELIDNRRPHTRAAIDTLIDAFLSINSS